MDSKRFDNLVLSLARGASRRSVLKGLLGLGGAAVVAEQADARTIGTRPTIPPPKPPACPLPKQLCGGVCCDAGKCKNGHCCPNAADVWCGNACCASGICTSDGDCCPAGQKACGSVCCPTAQSCARDGNQDICCDPATHSPCGHECCDGEFQCCDGECCPTGSVCLVRVLGGETDSIEEEMCCPADSVCTDRCCPSEAPQCCTLAGVSTCIAADACCGDCGPCQDCVDGVCVDRCATCEVCEDESCFPCGGEGGGVCCDGVCERESECCDSEDCIERYIDVDLQCTACVNGQCLRRGDTTGGPDCDFEGSGGTCCFGQCISAESRCCAEEGESCFGILPCCDGLICDVLASFTCVAPTTTTAGPTTTTTPDCLSDYSIQCEIGSQCCSGECRESGFSVQCGEDGGEIQSIHSYCCGSDGASCEDQACCCQGLECVIPDSGFFGYCVATTTTTSTAPPATTTSTAPPTTTTTGLPPCLGLQIRCNDGQCHDCCQASDCLPLGWDQDCVSCSLDGFCQPVTYNPCAVDGGVICNSSGQCLPCLPASHSCQETSQCCNLQFGAICNLNSVCTAG